MIPGRKTCRDYFLMEKILSIFGIGVEFLWKEEYTGSNVR